MKLIFMGTPDFAVPSLKGLIESGHKISLAVTQGDKPKGRGHKLAYPPVKEYALSSNVEVYQPDTMKSDEVYARLAADQPDGIVVVAYGKILPPRILELPRFGCINVHASLLPRYRGAAPIQWAVLNGEKEAGVTTMQMGPGLDTGDMLLQSRRAVPEGMTGGELHDLLAEDGACLLVETLRRLEAGCLFPVPQEGESNYAPMLGKALSPLDWNQRAEVLHNQVRGLNPWPSASFMIQNKVMKVHKTKVGVSTDKQPGEVIGLSPLTVACGEGTSLELLEIQYEGSRRMTAEEFLRGHPIPLGCQF